MPAQVYYSPFIPAFSGNGLPLPGARLYFFDTGTTDLAPIYEDSALTIPMENPVEANLAARFPNIYLDGDLVYRVRITDQYGTPLQTDIDPYYPGQALVVVPDTPEFAAPDGASLVGFELFATDSEPRTAEDKMNEEGSWLDGVTPQADRDAIIAKTDTDDRAGLLTDYVLQNRSFAGKIVRALGRIFADSAVIGDQSISMRGEPGRKNMDNSWDLDNAGTQILGSSLTEDVLRFDSSTRGANGRLHVDLQDLLVVGNRLDHADNTTPTAATDGNGITFKGGPNPGDGAQQLSISTWNLSVTQARMHNIELRDNTYGASFINTQIDRAGSCGIFGDDGGEGGESYFAGVTRAFQNGQDTALADTLRAGANLQLDSWGADMLSVSENRGCNGVFGGIFNINVLQAESGALGIAGSVGRQILLTGTLRGEMPAVIIAPKENYDGAVFYLDATSRNVRIGGLINGDILGANGRHFEIEAGFENLDVAMLQGILSVKDKRIGDWQTHTGGFVLTRNTGAGTATGAGGTPVTLVLSELVDTRQRFSDADDWYQTLFAEQVLIIGNLTFENIAAGHTAGTIYIEVEDGTGWTSTGELGREFPFNPAALRNTTTNSVTFPIMAPIVLRGANADRAAGQREGAKVRIRYVVSGGAATVTLVTSQSYISFINI